MTMIIIIIMTKIELIAIIRVKIILKTTKGKIIMKITKGKIIMKTTTRIIKMGAEEIMDILQEIQITMFQIILLEVKRIRLEISETESRSKNNST